MSRSSPKAAIASRRAAASASGSRPGSRTVRMPLPPPPAAGLTRSGKPIPSAARARTRVGLSGAVVAGQDRDAERGRQPACGRLVAHRPDRRRRRPDPADPGRLDRLGEVRVLGEEPEAGMERVGAGGQGRRDDGHGIEQVEAARARR